MIILKKAKGHCEGINIRSSILVLLSCMYVCIYTDTYEDLNCEYKCRDRKVSKVKLVKKETKDHL